MKMIVLMMKGREICNKGAALNLVDVGPAPVIVSPASVM